MKGLLASALFVVMAALAPAQEPREAEYTKSIKGTATSYDKADGAIILAQNEDEYKLLAGYVNKANKDDPYKFPTYDKGTVYVLVMSGEVKQTPGWQITIDAVKFVKPGKDDKDNGTFLIAATFEPPTRVASDKVTCNWQLVKIDKASIGQIDLTGRYKAKLVERRITFRESDPISAGEGSKKPTKK